jgi:hypothetical protein
MNNLCRLLIILLFSLFCLTTLHKQSHSANWLYITTNKDKKFYVDTDNIKINRKYHTIQFWQRYIYPSGSTVSLEIYDYNEKSYATIHLTTYDSNGNTISSSDCEPTIEKRHIVPGSIMDEILSKVLKLEGIK